ncbi:hypothetical protein LTR53_008955 [Teratosphaeriaceae sp. CCFEE 6253]|nr:hypothetical protein LTR53_008955 [Teratosphaeriaceae sp. CCFEE 6253]
MSETRNIVVLGASFGGLSIAHYLSKHTLPQLKKSTDAKYELHLVDPSTHFWWHIAAPREIVSVKEMPHERCFVPNMTGFDQYTDLRGSIHFHQGSAAGLDTTTRTVTLNTPGGGDEVLPYYALVIATGVRSPTPLTTLQGEHTLSEKALDEMNTKLASAKDIVISGGGPIGVETAGEIATHLNGKARITLVTSGSKLIPIFTAGRAVKAQKMLEKLGVTVVYNVKTTGSKESGPKTEIQLDNGKTMTADVFIPAYGVRPNTEFLPGNLRRKDGYVDTNPTTLRVDAAGPRVYCAGDVSAVNNGGVLLLQSAIPVLGANMSHDLLEDARVGTFAERKYVRKDGETQLVPIGAKGGVGAFAGWGMPSFVIAMVKGKDYFLNIHEGKKYVKA